jgi:hypothetical protein
MGLIQPDAGISQDFPQARQCPLKGIPDTLVG